MPALVRLNSEGSFFIVCFMSERESSKQEAKVSESLELQRHFEQPQIEKPHFELQPHLVGELVEVRPLRQEDWESLFAVASDPLIWEQHPAQDRYQEGVFKEFFREALESGGAFVVIDRQTGKI